VACICEGPSSNGGRDTSCPDSGFSPFHSTLYSGRIDTLLCKQRPFLGNEYARNNTVTVEKGSVFYVVRARAKLSVQEVFLWGVLSDERTGLSFVYAAGPRQVALLGSESLGLVAIFYSLRFATSLFIAFYDSQGHGGGIRPRLHTGILRTATANSYKPLDLTCGKTL
jgi:hypothetical protein